MPDHPRHHAGDESTSEQRWDTQGARDLYRQHIPAVYAYVRSRIPHHQDAEDIVSFTFLKAVEQMDTFHWHGVSAFRAWLFRIAYTAVQDYFRSQRRRAGAEPLNPTMPSDAPRLEDTWIQKEAAVQLTRLLGTLAPRRQEIVRLKFFAGLRNQDIAAILDIDERTVAAHLSRALDELHQRLAREETDRHERI